MCFSINCFCTIKCLSFIQMFNHPQKQFIASYSPPANIILLINGAIKRSSKIYHIASSLMPDLKHSYHDWTGWNHCLAIWHPQYEAFKRPKAALTSPASPHLPPPQHRLRIRKLTGSFGVGWGCGSTDLLLTKSPSPHWSAITLSPCMWIKTCLVSCVPTEGCCCCCHTGPPGMGSERERSLLIICDKSTPAHLLCGVLWQSIHPYRTADGDPHFKHCNSWTLGQTNHYMQMCVMKHFFLMKSCARKLKFWAGRGA